LIATVKVHLLEFPAASVAVKVFVVIPTGKLEPLGNPAVCVKVTPGQLSVAEIEKVTLLREH
jgi:hypothetical protein